MKRKREDLLYEALLQQAMQREQQGRHDDAFARSVRRPDGTEVVIIERRIDIRYDEDEHGATPEPVVFTAYRTDDNGMPLRDVKFAGMCKYGCVIRAQDLVLCRCCRKQICLPHSLLVGERAYCIKSFCLLIGIPFKILRFVYKLTRFCFMCITGMDTETGYHSDSEESLFQSYQDHTDLTDEE